MYLSICINVFKRVCVTGAGKGARRDKAKPALASIRFRIDNVAGGNEVVPL